MSLHQGPIHTEELTVESCLETLAKIQLQCQEEGVYHQDKIDCFLNQQTLIEPGSGNKIKLLDIRHLPDRYPENPVVCNLGQEVHRYILTIQGNLTILNEGCILLKTALGKETQILNNSSFKTLDISALKTLAETKLNLEHALVKFSNKHPRIEEGSVTALLKNALKEPLAVLTAKILMLTPPERFIIEYFGTLLDSQTTFKLLAKYQTSLATLTRLLPTLTPIIPKPIANEDWDDTFCGEFPSKIDLSERLEQLRISGGTPSLDDDDDDKRWAEVDEHTSSSSILTQYLQTSAPPTASVENPVQPVNSEEEKKNSTVELPGL